LRKICNSENISYTEEYNPKYGMSCYGLAEIYREKNQLQVALDYHSKYIAILNKIDAKYDLAEAYYQLGLTYQKMGELQNSEENFQEAIQLFERMGAPKQVEKVEKAMKSG